MVGLGNPGAKYQNTRHNLGALVVERFSQLHDSKFQTKSKLHADVAETSVSGVKSVLARPTTYMNESGVAVARVASYYSVPAQRIIIVHDELDLSFATLRLKLGGGDNGHNGVISVKENLGTSEFIRVRMGIGRPSGAQAPADYVLAKFDSVQSEALPSTLDLGSTAIEALLVHGLATAQNEFNS